MIRLLHNISQRQIQDLSHLSDLDRDLSDLSDRDRDLSDLSYMI